MPGNVITLDMNARPTALGRSPLVLFSRLRMRLLWLVLMATLPALVLVILIAHVQRREAAVSAQNEAVRVVRAAANTQKERIEAARQLLLVLAQNPEVRQQNAAACARLFASLQPLRVGYATLGAADADGHVFARGLGAGGPASVADREFFKRALKTQKFVAADYETNQPGVKARLNVALPVLDRAAGQRPIVLFAALELNWLNQFAAQSDLPDGSTVAIIDPHRQILLRYPDVGRIWPRQFLDELPEFRTLLERNKEGPERFRDAEDADHFFAINPLSRTAGIADAWVIASIPASAVFASAHRLLIQNLLYLGVVSVLALVASWFGGEYGKVRKLVVATQQLARGDLKARTGIENDRGELGQLASAFDEMAASLEQRQAELTRLNEQLEHRVATRTLELQRSNEELEQFAYVASHDLQEPLRMVMNYMQLLRQRYHDHLDTNAQDFIGFALDGAVRMQRLINDLLTFSRVGTQGKPLEPADCEEVLGRVLNNLAVAIEESGAAVTHDALPTVRGDASQLMQLLQNLVGNAIKFRADKPPAIHVGARRKGREWELSVRDNGIGIAPKDFARIFVIFQRLHGREKYPGTGIGLSICKKIVERHGGRIWVESQPGQGTTFHFTLKAVD